MIIKKVEIKNNKVKITTDDKNDFIISLETYLSNNIVLNDEIDNEKILFLKEQDDINLAKSELINKISKKRLSKRECLIFLNEYGMSNDNVNQIIKDLENISFINDIELAQLIIEHCMFTKKGVKAIKEKLKKRYIEGDYNYLIEKFLDREVYQKNIIYQLNKYFKHGSKKSQIELKNYLIIKMIDNGFEKEDFMAYLDDYRVDETAFLKKEIEVFFKTREVNHENIAKITKKLLSKGFNYGIIRDVIRECVGDEIN